MNFASLPYLLFLVIVATIYFSIGKKYRSIFLLLGSYFFYSIFGFGFAALMLITSGVTYYFTLLSYKSSNHIKRKLFFYFALIIDLLFFILFKYVHIIDIDVMNWPNFTVQKVLIPIGISFYTFKTVGYCIDIYKRKYEPINSFTEYALSVSFFPQLIAGPIEKSKTICSQLNHSTYNKQNILEGGKLILWGIFKKIVIADSIAQITSSAFNKITNYHGTDYLIIFFAFAYQVYADFSGYSDIAIGSAKFFDVHLPANFNKPFFSKSFKEFWVRWHITMSQWLRDYIYIPLGGNNLGKLRSIFNIFIVFLISGFWHGASLNFILFSQVAFLFLLIETAAFYLWKKVYINSKLELPYIIKRIINYLVIVGYVAFLCIFFQYNNINDITYVIKNSYSLNIGNLGSQKTIYLFITILVFELLQHFQLSPVGHCFQKVKSFHLRLIMYLAMLFSILTLSSRLDVTFQYFQF